MIIIGNITTARFDYCPEPITPFILSEAQYYFLEDHYINGTYFFAGTTAFADGVVIPFDWIPTPNVDPLNTPAVSAYYAAGPKIQGLTRQQFSPLPVRRPVTYWVEVGSDIWALTGLGAGLPPKGGF